MKHSNLMILAGGISSRMKKSLEARANIDPGLKSEAQEKSKAMLGIGESSRPFLDYLLYNAREVGYNDVVIIISERDPSIRQYYGDKEKGNDFHGLSISYAVQTIPPDRTKPLGTADAVVRGLNVRKDWRGQKFTVCNSDNLYSRTVLKTLLDTDQPNAMIDYDRDALGFDASRVAHFSVIHKDDEGFLTGIIEKPSAQEIEQAKGKLGAIGVSMNIFRLDYTMVLPFVTDVPLHPVRLEKELPTAITNMVKRHPKSLYTYPFAEHVPDLTSIDDVERVKEYLSKEFGGMRW